MLNPKSGKGDSQSMFEKTLKPLMEEFALSYELFVTKRAKEAEDYLQRFVSLHQLVTKNQKPNFFVFIFVTILKGESPVCLNNMNCNNNKNQSKEISCFVFGL